MLSPILEIIPEQGRSISHLLHFVCGMLSPDVIFVQLVSLVVDSFVCGFEYNSTDYAGTSQRKGGTIALHFVSNHIRTTA